MNSVKPLENNGYQELEPLPSTPEVGGRRVGPEVLSGGDSFLNCTSCNTREKRPCTLPGQCYRPNPVSASMGDPAPKL